MTPESATLNQDNPQTNRSAVVSDQEKGRDRQQAALLAFARRANALPNLDLLLQDAATLLAETVGAQFCGIAECLSGDRLQMKVIPVHSEDILADSKTREIDMDPSMSLAAYSLSSAGPVVSPCVEKDQRFSDQFLQKLGFISLLSVPLYINNAPFGTLSVYSKEECEFNGGDIAFAETISNLLIASVARVHAENELREKTAGMATILDMVDNLVLELSKEGRVETVNPTSIEMFGWDSKKIIGQRFLEVVTSAENDGGLHACFRDSIKTKDQQRFTGSFKVAKSETRFIAWTILPRMDEQGDLNSMLVTGTDCTKETLLANELKQTQEHADNALQMLRELKVESECKVAEAESNLAAIDNKISVLSDVETQSATVNVKSSPAFDKLGSRMKAKPSGDSETEVAVTESSETEEDQFSKIETNSGVEQRKSPRRAFRYRQLIAPIHGGVMPSRRKFFQVACEDTSAGGLCFVMDSPPDFNELVVALGRAPAFSYFTAEVLRVNEKYLGDEKVYLVGCRFTGRVSI